MTPVPMVLGTEQDRRYGKGSGEVMVVVELCRAAPDRVGARWVGE